MSDRSSITNNNFPTATPEIEELLGFKRESAHKDEQVVESAYKEHISNLPIVEGHVIEHSNDNSHSHKAEGIDGHPVDGSDIAGEHTSMDDHNSKESAFSALVKSVLPYVAVFGVGLLLYYFFFSRVDFGGVLSRINTSKITETARNIESSKDSALDSLKKEYNDEYYRWIGGHYFDVSDTSLLDPDRDLSGNGLSNFQKFLLGLNPRAYDTLGLGMADSEALASGINPLSGGKLTENQKGILEKYVDMEIVMNRLTLSNMRGGGAEQVQASPLSSSLGYSGQVAGTSLRSENQSDNRVQNDYALNPATQGLFGQLSQIDIDTNVPGRLEVPSLNINVPIIWTQDPKNFDKDLQSGVVHYPGTALPNQVGTTYISGHSSNYVWAKGDFNQVFSKLGNLPDNTSFKVTVVQKNGRDARLHYIVTRSQEYKATDQEQFLNAGKPVVALSTCWPVGSTAKRLVVFGELTQVERD